MPERHLALSRCTVIEQLYFTIISAPPCGRGSHGLAAQQAGGHCPVRWGQGVGLTPGITVISRGQVAASPICYSHPAVQKGEGANNTL